MGFLIYVYHAKRAVDKESRSILRRAESLPLCQDGLLESRSAVPLEFPDGQALMEYCKIIETRTDDTLADETIVAIVKKGYLDKQRGRALRKAEVITVRNL